MDPVNFIKIILSKEYRSKGIRLPVKFTEEYGKYLSETVTLKVPKGDVWKVGIHKSGDEIWLKNGWGEFAELYNVGFSDMLMFKYQGVSTFGVVIFNATASEIEYPQKKDRGRNSVKRNAGKRPVYTDESETTIPTDESETTSDDSSSSWSGGQEHGIKIKDEGECSSKAQRREEGRGGIKKVKADLECDKPFMVYIDKSHLTNRGVLLPAGLRKNLLRGLKSCKCLLQLKNNGKLKKWKVVAHSGGYLGDADWMMFVEDNGVKVGDVCVFEMIHKDKNALVVNICRSGS